MWKVRSIKLALPAIVLVAAVAAAFGLRADAARAGSAVAIEEVQLCDLGEYLDKLDASGATVVSVFPANAYEPATAETFCPCGQVAAPCFIAVGWHVRSVYVVSKE
jgi:hypothetical protein